MGILRRCRVIGVIKQVMDLSVLRRHGSLNALLSRHEEHRRIEVWLRAHLPGSVAAACSVVCVHQGELEVAAPHPLPANRLKILLPELLPQLRQIFPQVAAVRVKIKPQNAPAAAAPFRLPESRMADLQQAAAALKAKGGNATVLAALERVLDRQAALRDGGAGGAAPFRQPEDF